MAEIFHYEWKISSIRNGRNRFSLLGPALFSEFGKVSSQCFLATPSRNAFRKN